MLARPAMCRYVRSADWSASKALKPAHTISPPKSAVSAHMPRRSHGLAGVCGKVYAAHMHDTATSSTPSGKAGCNRATVV
jgi:hypothetical protein